MRSIKVKILISTLTILVTLVTVLGGVAGYFNYRSTVRSLEDTMTETVKIAANQVEATLNGYKNLLMEIGENHILSYGTLTKGKYEADSQVNSTESVEVYKKHFEIVAKEICERHNFKQFSVVNEQGITIEGEDVSNREYFEKVIKTGKPFISEPIISQSDGKTIIVMAAPLKENQQMKGLVLAAVGAEFLSDIVTEISIGKNGNAAILDKNGRTIAYKDIQLVLDGYNTQENVSKDPSLKELATIEKKMIAGETGFGEYTYQGARKFMAYTPIEGTNGWSIQVGVEQKDFLGDTYRTIVIISIVSIICLIVASILNIKLASSIIEPIKQCIQRITLLAEGDLRSPVPEIHSKDEIGLLAESTSTIVKTVNKIISDMDDTLNELGKGNFTVESLDRNMYVGDFKVLLLASDKIIENLTITLEQIDQASNQVASGAEDIARGAGELANGATEQASIIEEFIASTEEISEKVKENMIQVQETSESSKLAREKANIGTQMMKQMVKAMESINNSSQNIVDIIKIIDAIADQTNLLALNAAIESARAGEAGRGFAVVANEIRDLANKSSKAVKDVEEIVKDSFVKVEEGRHIAKQTANNLSEIVDTIDKTAQISQVVLNNSKQQKVTIEEVVVGTKQLATTVELTTSTSQENAAVSEELAGQAENLQKLISNFELRI